jgi:hypothetical protein
MTNRSLITQARRIAKSSASVTSEELARRIALLAANYAADILRSLKGK